ncbi:amino acid adenylation domain-containing protein, partial [Chryseobacterium sp. JM1]|uniref:amino acid adenylation domain-containing protein n=1 Tax=Chryseobacterium sp. JM1 TaxID=1233950 RepID=UPI0004E77DF1
MILKYLGQGLSSAERPSIQFNYLGDFDDATGSTFQYTTENMGDPVSKDNQRTDILLDVSGMTVNGEMTINIRYSDKVFDESTVQKVLSSYQAHLEQMIITDDEQKVILTPSDLTYNGLSFQTIQEITKNNEVEDIYELSPMQQGLYYHWLLDPKGSTYFMQTSYRMKSQSLDPSKVEKAFGKLLNRYTILRTSFDNRFGEVPLQIVHPQANVDFNYQVIESKDSLENDLEMIRNNDIIRGFALNNPTQLRLILVELPDNAYEFIWSYHHIIMDGWCLSILINDFSAILDSLQQEVELSLPEPQKYSSYLKWLGKIDKNSSSQYWENYLKGVSAPTLIPFEKSIKGEKPHFATEKFSIEDNELKEINQLCQQLGITLNTYVQAAWSYLLSSYNASEEIIFGAVVSGRPPDIEGIENMVGLFINTIPVRITVNKDDTPRSLLKKLHQDSVQNTGNHFNSLAEIQSLSPLGKDLISNIVIFENYVKNEKESFENVKVFDQSNYDFTLAIEPNENSLNIDFEYNTSVYSSAITALASHLRNTLCHFKTFVDTPLSEFGYLSISEREILLKEFNNTEESYDSTSTIISLFEKQTVLTPEATALVYEDTQLTYQELNAQACDLAFQLQTAYGIKKGDHVGVMIDRSEKQIVSILGILKSGGVYVPVDVNLPESRKSVMADNLQLIITESFYFFDLDFYSGDSLAIDVELTGEGSEDFESTALDGGDIAYIIYTSGSTGEPKGVLNTHEGILNTMLFQKNFFKVSQCNNIAQFSSFSFDASISEIFMTLLSGKTLHILSDAVRKDSHAFEEYVDKYSIDLVTLPPAFFSLLHIERLQKLQGLITAGEAAIVGKAKEFLKYGTFYNAYGPTETSICASVYKIDKGYDLELNTIPIGKPISNTEVYILDSNKHLVPIGVSGELYIAGSGLARGYLNREDLTSEKFVANPFVEGTKMYRTGDLGRWLPDGNIEYLGRIDHQVKI